MLNASNFNKNTVEDNYKTVKSFCESNLLLAQNDYLIKQEIEKEKKEIAKVLTCIKIIDKRLGAQQKYIFDMALQCDRINRMQDDLHKSTVIIKDQINQFTLDFPKEHHERKIDQAEELAERLLKILPTKSKRYTYFQMLVRMVAFLHNTTETSVKMKTYRRMKKIDPAFSSYATPGKYESLFRWITGNEKASRLFLKVILKDAQYLGGRE